MCGKSNSRSAYDLNRPYHDLSILLRSAVSSVSCAGTTFLLHRSGRRRLQRVLSLRTIAALHRLLAAEARVAVARALAAHRLVHALERYVGQRVAAQLRGDLIDRAFVGDHLL